MNLMDVNREFSTEEAMFNSPTMPYRELISSVSSAQ